MISSREIILSNTYAAYLKLEEIFGAQIEKNSILCTLNFVVQKIGPLPIISGDITPITRVK